MSLAQALSAAESQYRADEDFARRLDAEDPLSAFRNRFAIPRDRDGRPVIYFCGNSLGLMPKAARTAVEQELDDWAALGVEAHFSAKTPWYSYHEQCREPLARLVGGLPTEVVVMNGLTVNLHLMLVSFYRPTAEKFKILIEDSAFPSDRYALQSQLRWHGLDPEQALLVATPRPGEATLRTEDITALIEERGSEIAVVLFGGVSYFTGQLFDMQCLAAAAHEHRCITGFDLAHAAGNVPLELHDWQADFAVWCSYKYLNAGPGSIAGCYVHESHGRDRSLSRFAGWWGNDPASRFQMDPDFVPREGADGWQVSNPPILSTAPLRESLAIFSEAGMPALRRKSRRLTGYLEYLIDRIPSQRMRLLTPREADARGCQLSIHVSDGARELFGQLKASGVVADFREPDVIRVAPVPLYNTFHEVWRFAEILRKAVAGTAPGSAR